MKTPEEYIQGFDNWVDKGKRLLKIGDTVFLLMLLHDDSTATVYACDNFHTYKGWIRISEFGKMISEKRTRLLISMGMDHTTLYSFAYDIILADSCCRTDRDDTLFSFDQIDTGQLPERVLKELMIQKLSK